MGSRSGDPDLLRFFGYFEDEIVRTSQPLILVSAIGSDRRGC